jgi:glycosyltransferase involved in cell wall biosynthesis
VFFDITELIDNPVRTGIQRIERELMRHWPGPAPLSPCYFDKKKNCFVLLPGEVIEVFMASAAGDVSVAEEQACLAPLAARAAPLDASKQYDCLLNTELFFDEARANAYVALAKADRLRLYWLVMDFIPFLRPEQFPGVHIKDCMHFLRALRTIRKVGFISEKTLLDYSRRILRQAAPLAPVFPPGGNGLDLPLQSFEPERRLFVTVGTIEPRKNVASILEAFEKLWRAGSEAALTLVGDMKESAKKERQILERLAGDPRLQSIGPVSDERLRSIMTRARATVFASTSEGFGVPPYESLAVGIPVIVTEDLPSIQLIPSLGQIRLPRPDADSIAAAVAKLMDDEFARSLWREAANVRIPTWEDLARRVSAWVQEL